MASLRMPDSEEYDYRVNDVLKTTAPSVFGVTFTESTRNAFDGIGNSILDIVKMNPIEGSNQLAMDKTVSGVLEYGIKTNSATLILNTTMNSTEMALMPDLLYRHSMGLTILYCVAYLFVFAVGLVGNCFVIAVVFRTPRMRTVTNFFIVNLAVADILVIVFCLPATLMSNIFVRKYNFLFHYFSC